MTWSWYAETWHGPAVATLLPQIKGWQAWLATDVDALSRGRPRTQELRATLGVALEFGTWEALAVRGGSGRRRRWNSWGGGCGRRRKEAR